MNGVQRAGSRIASSHRVIWSIIIGQCTHELKCMAMHIVHPLLKDTLGGAANCVNKRETQSPPVIYCDK